MMDKQHCWESVFGREADPLVTIVTGDTLAKKIINPHLAIGLTADGHDVVRH